MTATQKTENSASSSSVEAVAVPPDHVDQVWPIYRPLVAPALLRTREMDAETVRRLAKEGRLQLWIAWDFEAKEALAGAATDVYEGPLRRIGRVVLCGGRLRNLWIHLLAQLEEWARDEGCVALEITGRKGWARALPDGYQATSYTFQKEL